MNLYINVVGNAIKIKVLNSFKISNDKIIEFKKHIWNNLQMKLNVKIEPKIFSTFVFYVSYVRI